jgi:hypothetical protein
MPSGALGQQITFAAELDPDENYSKFVIVKARRNDTVRKIAARRGHPEMAHEILLLNKGKKLLPVTRSHGKIVKHQPGLRSITQKLREHASLRLPGTLKRGDSFSVTAGDNRPKITGGYAKYDTVDVPGRIGLNRFDGYDPLTIDIPVQFEGYADDDGPTVEASIRKLERMAGRGTYPGAAFGPPAVVRVSVTDNTGNIVPLVPTSYQWTPRNENAPLYRITGISWDDGSLSDRTGQRVRQTATVTVTQYTPLIIHERSAARRAQSRSTAQGKGGKSG